MKYVRRSFLLAIVLCIVITPNLHAANGMCTAEYATCEESGDQQPGGGGTGGGGSSTCLRCVMPQDNYAYCMHTDNTEKAGGMVLRNCDVYLQCYWAGTTSCFYTCSGTTCYWV